MWEGTPVSAWFPIRISQGGVGMADAVSSFRCPLSSYVFLSVIIGRVFVCRKFGITLQVESRWRVQLCDDVFLKWCYD